MRREWIEMGWLMLSEPTGKSPSMRREWIEIEKESERYAAKSVSLHAEGVD